MNNNSNNNKSTSFRNGRSSMRRSTIAASHRPSLVLSDVFPHTDVEKQITVHHERVFEGMVEDVLLTEQETAEKEEEEHTEEQPTQKTEDDLVALMGEDDDIEPSSSRRVRRHSSYESRRRRQGMRDHNKMKQALPSKDNKQGSRMELLEHLHDISMDLSQMMKSSTTMSISGGGSSLGEEETLAESCPVLSYIMEDDEDMAELTHGRRRRNLRRLRSRRRRERGISVIPEDDQQRRQEQQSSSSSTAPADDNDGDELKSYTMELPEESDDDEDVEQKPRAYRAPKISSYHLLMTSMQMADNMNDVTSIMESFSSLHSSSKDVMNFPSPSTSLRKKNPSPFPTTPEERYVASLTAPGGAASSEADKPGQMLSSAPTALPMGQHPMVPASGIARGPIARGA